MTKDLQDIILLALPTLILLISWVVFKQRQYKKYIFSLAWVFVVFFLAAFGALTYKETGMDNSRMASAILYPSTTFLNGPLLISSIKEKVNRFWLFLFAIILAPLSYAITVIALLFSGQIWI